jgi:hypothetical protein
MKTDQFPVIARRDLFRGTASLLGGAALGLAPTFGLAQGVKAGPAPSAPVAPTQPMSIGYWDGVRFVAAESVAAGDVTLEHVRLTVTSSQGGGLRAIEANGLVPTGKSIQKVPFTLWAAPPTGATKTSAVVPTSVGEGLSLNAFIGSGKQVLTLRTDRSAGPKLREGTYVIAQGRVDWASLSLNARGELVSGGAAGRPVASPHVLIAVQRS